MDECIEYSEHGPRKRHEKVKSYQNDIFVAVLSITREYVDDSRLIHCQRLAIQQPMLPAT